MRDTIGPLVTFGVNESLRAARRSGEAAVECSLDLDRTRTRVELNGAGWTLGGRAYPFLDECKERSIYHWTGGRFEPLARFSGSLIKLVPTQWGTPTFEIDGIKMLVSERISPWADAERKVALIRPRGKVVLDTCGGLGYFAAWCLAERSAHVLSYEKNPDVIWLRSFNPWSPDNIERRAVAGMTLTHADVTERIAGHASGSVDAVLHDPPRFGIAGELYSQVFYDELARVLRHRGQLFHYTGAPNKHSGGRDLPNEVASRLKRSGFDTRFCLDGVLAQKVRKAF
jgi:predicted methyltransferase